MRGWGTLFIILGIGSYVLPHFDLQFKLISIFGQSPWVGVSFIVIGAALLLMSSRREAA